MAENFIPLVRRIPKLYRAARQAVELIDSAQMSNRHPDNPDWQAGYRACLEDMIGSEVVHQLREELYSIAPHVVANAMAMAPEGGAS